MKPARRFKGIYLWRLNFICNCHHSIVNADYQFYPWYLVCKFWVNFRMRPSYTGRNRFWVTWFESFFYKIWCFGNFYHIICSISTDIIEVLLLELLWSFKIRSCSIIGEGLGEKRTNCLMSWTSFWYFYC